jgi:hypothetical protein
MVIDGYKWLTLVNGTVYMALRLCVGPIDIWYMLLLQLLCLFTPITVVTVKSIQQSVTLVLISYHDQ